mgnify:CR=1 FL=1
MIDTSHQSAAHLPMALVMDPKPLSVGLTDHLTRFYRVVHCSSLPLTLQTLAVEQPTLFVVSSRFAPTKLIQVLEALKERTTQSLIPVIINLDLDQPSITLPGTRWAGKLGFITSDTSQNEFAALIERLFATHSSKC